MLSIVVCVKQVPDPEAPASTFRIDPEVKRAIPAKGTAPVLNPFDENALEAALRIKDTQVAEITVISLGRQLSRRVLQKALAAGASKLILLDDEAFNSFDSYFTAYILANAIKTKIGKYDIILCGREASDTDAGQTGSGIAEILGIPSVTVARKVEVKNEKLWVERVVSDGYELIEAPMPVLVTVSSELGELRSATTKAYIEAQKKPVTVYNRQDLGGCVYAVERASLLKLFTLVREVKCQLIEGETAEEAGAKLATKLREAGMI